MPAVYLLNEQLADSSKCLLILEERTLYFPHGCEIGTPFFQDSSMGCDSGSRVKG